jgi:hypothetical protein
VHETIQSKNKKQLRALTHETAKVMRAAKIRQPARSVGSEIPQPKVEARKPLSRV